MYNHDEYRIIRVTESSFLCLFFFLLHLIYVKTLFYSFSCPTSHYTISLPHTNALYCHNQLAISQFLTFNTPTNGSIYLKFTHRLVKICTNMFSRMIPIKSSGIIIQAILRGRELNCYISYIIVIFILNSKFLRFIHQRTFKLRKCLGF